MTSGLNMRLSITLLFRMMISEVNIFNGWFGYAMPPYALNIKYARRQSFSFVCVRDYFVFTF